MNRGRWLDHLPPWLAWGAIASTGSYTGGEVGAMAVPLLAGALVEWRRGNLQRFRRLLELAALAVFLFQVATRTGVLATVLNTLFALCGVRLCLPRELPQRRQVLLMGFLLFLTTALATSELDFLVWSLLWVAGAAACLLEFNWGKSAQLEQGQTHRPAPFGRIPAWTAAVAVMAGGFFLVLPRLHLGVRGLPLGIQSLTGLHAGLSDVVDLSGAGPVQANSDVVMRIIPVQGRQREVQRAFALLRGMALENLDGQRWELDRDTPSHYPWGRGFSGSFPPLAECFVSPDPHSVVPLPYGRLALEPPEGEQIRGGPGASVRWWLPVRRILPLRVGVEPRESDPEPPPAGARRLALTATGPPTASALRFSRRAVPDDLPPRQLAAGLAQALRGFRYSLDNPSGGAADPLQDFLERTRAGHCEFFASALAIMLRQRGVPARVVVGYRLGPWLQEGGYFLVTQNEAHSWVEYYDAQARGWRTEDPTPALPASTMNTGSFAAAFARLADTVRFGWDRHVVRFSDEDQVAGFDWLSVKVGSLARHRLPELRAGLTSLAVLAALAILAWRARGGLPFLPWGVPGSPGAIPEFRPLLRAAGGLAKPLPGETARAWLARLRGTRADRAAQLEALAREADAVAYGGKGRSALARLAKEEARAWRRQP